MTDQQLIDSYGVFSHDLVKLYSIITGFEQKASEIGSAEHMTFGEWNAAY